MHVMSLTLNYNWKLDTQLFSHLKDIKNKTGPAEKKNQVEVKWRLLEIIETLQQYRQ